MEGERSGCSGSNLIILSPEKLAKLGIDVLLSNKKTENSTNVKSSVSNSKKDKHTRRRNSKSNSGTSFPTHDSNLDEHVSSKSPKGRTRKGKDLSKQYPSKPISKNEKKIIFKKPAVNILTEYLTKKGSANLDARKVEGGLNHSEKNEVVLKESMKKNCYTKCISTSYEKSTSEGESDINSGESSSNKIILSSLTNTDKIKMISNTPVSFTQNEINNMLPSNKMISSASTGTFEEKQTDHSKNFKGVTQLQQTIVDSTPQEEDCTTDRYPNEQKSKYQVSKLNSELGNNSVSETEIMENKSFTEKSAAIVNLNKKESICKPLSSMKDQVDKKITTESEKSVVTNGRQKNKELKRKRTAFVPKIVEQSTLNTETNINKNENRSYTEEQSCTSIETSSVLLHTIFTENIEDIVEESKPNGKMVPRMSPSIISPKQAIEVGKVNMDLTTEKKKFDECPNISSSASMRREPLDDKMDSCNTKEIEAESYIDKFVKEKSLIQSGDIGKTASNQEQQEDPSSAISNSKTKKQTTLTGFCTSNISNKKTMNQFIETPNSINTSTPIIKQGRKRKNDNQSPKLEHSSRERKHRKVKNNDNDNKIEVEISLINMELKETDSSTTKNEEILNTTDDKVNASDIEGKMEISSCSMTPTPLKKRGRKSKTSIDDKINALDIEDKMEISNCSITPTPSKTRGRKRKIVDYSEHKETPKSNSTTENTAIQSDSINESEADNLYSDAKSSSKSKYTFHGQTSVMMNSIFSAAFKSSNEVSAEENLEVATPVTQKSKRGRPRTNESLMLLDDENKAFCVICETKVPHTNWEKHNQSKHYNLAWCTGQCSLAIDDDKFVKKVLKFHPKKKIQLKCFKCDQLSTTVPSYIVHLEECRGILVEGKVVCAVCDVKMNREEWINHKLKHNNLAWRIGDVPLDLNDQNLVLSILNALYKAKKPLTCEKCGITKKSVVGYISHRSQCGVDGEEAQIECEICFKKVLPVSMQSHMKGSHGPKTHKSDDIDVSTEGPRKKRRAATNALSMLEQLNDDGGMPYFLLQMDLKKHTFVLPLLENELKEHKILSCKYRNCEFKVDDTKSFLDHMANCELKPNEYYTCTKCLSALSQEEKKDHLKKCHEVTGSGDEYAPFDPSDDENEDQQRSKRKPKTCKTVTGVTKEISVRTMPRCVMNCRRQISPNSLVFPKAFKYTLEFCQLNYDNPNLFNNLRYTDSDWCLLNEELLDEYLPKITKSCRVAWKKAKNENGILGEEPTFKELEIFEHVEEDNTTTIFCGGPISSLAWLPTPYQTENCTQILAVATYKDYDEKYSSFKYYNEPSVIQFWNFGKLRNKMKLPEPKLHFCLAVDFGPIWNMEWCPSGCFDAHRNGILAVAGSQPSVYIYAIPVLGDDQTELIYKVKPLLKLQLVLEIGMMKRETYPSKVSWGKARGHQHLAVGYTDGSVGIFDLETDSHLLKFKDEEGIDVILPYKVIKAHKHCITALTLIHLSGGSRWLFTGSFDRNLSVWDLTNDSAYTTTSKRVVSDGVWLTNWASFVSASDESGSINAIVHGVVNSYRNYLSEPATMLKSHSTISSISFSDWLNACIQGSSEGEICLYLPAQLIYAFDNSKFSTFSYYLNTTYLFDTTKSAEERIADHKKKQAIGNPVQKSTGNKRGSLADMLERSGNYESHEPLMFKQATDKYGILFCDFTRDTFKDLPNVRNHKSSDFTMMKFTSPDRYPLNAITKISFNPNCYSSLYLAVGYQAGFVRLNYLKFLENDTQVKI